MVTLIPVVLLFVFGSGSLADFAFALMVGIASGAYSSIFIASPLLAILLEREPQFRRRRHELRGTESPEKGSAVAEAGRGGAKRRRLKRGRRGLPSPPAGPSAWPRPLEALTLTGVCFPPVLANTIPTCARGQTARRGGSTISSP